MPFLKQIHFALTSDELIYPYYLSILSALKTQDVQCVNLWCFKKPIGAYYPLLENRLRLRIVERPDFPALRDKPMAFQYAHLSDWIEWKSLYEEGGMFCDLDTFCLKDAISMMEPQYEVVAALEAYELDTFVDGLHIGIVLARRGSQIIKNVLDISLQNLQDPAMEWAGTGPPIFASVCKRAENRPKVLFTDWGVLGGWGDRVVRLFEENGHVWDRARILHLYAYGMKIEFAGITEQYISESKAIYPRLVRKTLQPEEWGPNMRAHKRTKRPRLDDMEVTVCDNLPLDEQLVHFVNTGPDFTYTYYIGVMTALQAYGREKVILWIVEEPSGIYYDSIKGRVTIRKFTGIEDVSILADISDHNKRVALFDFAAWHVAYHYGGIVMGLDSITLKPHFDLLEQDKQLMAGIDSELEDNSYCMHGAIVRKGSALGRQLLDRSQAALNNREYRWGAAGIIPFLHICWDNPNEISIAPFGMVGGFSHDNTPFYITRDDGELLHPDTRTIPLYGSSSNTNSVFDLEHIKRGRSLYARLVKKLLREQEWNPSGAELFPPGAPAVSVSSLPAPTRTVREIKRFHLLGLPHLPTNQDEALACAYSQKVIKMAKMLKSLGHTVIFYGVEGSTVQCDEFVQVSTKAILQQAYGGYDRKSQTYKHHVGDIAYRTFNNNAVVEIRRRMLPEDFLLLPFAPQGYSNILNNFYTTSIDDPTRLYLTVEMGIGYNSPLCIFKVYESYAQMHYIWGLHDDQKRNPNGRNGNWYEVVIPNYFDPTEFDYSDKKSDYFFYLGRMIKRKGIMEAQKVMEQIGGKLIMAGQDGGEGVPLVGENIKYIGFADMEKRRKLLAGAKALLVPTIYIGPFEGVSIEAAFSGTPVITTDWGCFAENVIHGKTGYRCRTLDQFVWAAKNIGNIKPADCYQFAMENFSLDRVRWMYEEYFNMILDIKRGPGWSAIHDDRKNLDWLSRTYP